jgi:indole-3-glycerol phosphate synthase
MNILEQIIKAKRARLLESKRKASLEQIRAQAIALRAERQPHRLLSMLSKTDRVNIIAEIKRASPSKGLIRGEVNPAEVAGAYEVGGAAAISVLTEEDYFRGSLDDLRAVREAVSLPLLRKDFIFDEYQVYESAAAGADAILLIVAALDDGNLKRLRTIAADELRIDALVEVHTAQEMHRAANCEAKIIGVNNRDLLTFEVSLETSVRLALVAPTGAVLISESGIESGEDIRRLRSLGYRGFLIGEKLMRADKPELVLSELIGKSE